MERFALAVTLVLMGVPLWIFGLAVGRRKFDLVFGDYNVETTAEPAWDTAHVAAGRDFRRLGVLLSLAGPVLFVVGFPVAGWIFGVLMAVVVVGVYVAAMRALAHVARHQLRGR